MNVLALSPAMILLGSRHSSLLTFAQENICRVAGRAGIRGTRTGRCHPSPQLRPGLTGACTEDLKAGWQLELGEGKRSEVTTKSEGSSAVELVEPMSDLTAKYSAVCYHLPAFTPPIISRP